MLPELERGEVEPERRQLPAQVLDLAPCDPLESVLRERFLDLGELRIELFRVLVPPGERRLLAGQVRPGPADTLGDEPEPLAVRLVRVPPPELPIELREELGVAGEAGGEGPRDRVRRRGRGHRLGEACRDGLVAAEDVVGVDPERPLRDLGRDRGIAVAIAADPRRPAQERGHPRRSGPAAAGVPGFAGLRCGEWLVEGGVGRAEQPRHRPEQRLVEERERRPDLVERARGDRSQVGGPPQQRDLLAQPASDVAILGWPAGRDRRGGRAAGRPGEARGGASAGGPRSGGP